MGCLQLSYYEDLSGFTGVSQLKVIYVNPRLRAKKGSDFSGVDYYPFGEKMPGRFDNGNAPTGEGMFGYQGQEKVGNGSKWYNFQLRMYNPSIGRWNTIDPYAQHYSPYLAMSNNPISYIDPDGGRDRKSVDQEHAMSVINARLGLSSYLRFYGAESVDDKIVLSILGITHGTGGGGAGGGGGGLSANAYGPNSGLDSWQDNVFGTMAFNESEDGTRSLTLAEAAGIVNRLDAVGLGGLYAGGGLKDAQDNFDRAKRQAKRQADLVANNGSIDIEEFVVTEIGIDHTAAISKHIREYLNSKSDYHGPVPSLSQGLGSDVKGGGNGLDPSTVDQNYLGSHYIGPNNPMKKDGITPDYSTPAKTLAGANAMIHDKAYDRLEITGASGLFFDTRAIPADWQFVRNNLAAGVTMQYTDPLNAWKATVSAIGLGIAATPKTVFHYYQKGAAIGNSHGQNAFDYGRPKW